MPDAEGIVKIVGLIGSFVGTAGGAMAVYLFKALRADQKTRRHGPRPIFENGEREAIREALSIFGRASNDYRTRLGELEAQSEAGHRTHATLQDRLARLEHRFNALQDQLGR